ncbi:MAG: VOC family protein [Ottowia sp.]|uniref:VOC family protein n=1 Tax=Ottowia sp. TaxID=1898956 RepID=UPI0039E30E3E
MTRKIDHIVWAGSDLNVLMADFMSMTGVEAVLAGRHPTLGTHNALASLSDDVYFELLAADSHGQTSKNMGGQLAKFTSPQIFAYMFKASDLEKLKECLAEEGIESDLVTLSRTTMTGDTLTWRLLIPKDSQFASFLPVFIDWMDTPHPSTSAPKGCALIQMRIHHPNAPRLTELLAKLDCPIEVLSADTPDFEVTLASPKGVITLHGNGQRINA